MWSCNVVKHCDIWLVWYMMSITTYCSVNTAIKKNCALGYKAYLWTTSLLNMVKKIWQTNKWWMHGTMTIIWELPLLWRVVPALLQQVVSSSNPDTSVSPSTGKMWMLHWIRFRQLINIGVQNYGTYHSWSITFLSIKLMYTYIYFSPPHPPIKRSSHPPLPKANQN